MLSAQGGVEIEQVAEDNPDAIARSTSTRSTGSTEAPCRAVGRGRQAQPAGHRRRRRHPVKLYQRYVEGDCDLVEINPLILTPEGKVHALDAKVTLDDNATFRHPEWDELRRHPRCSTRASACRTRRACSTSASTATSASSPTAPASP